MFGLTVVVIFWMIRLQFVKMPISYAGNNHLFLWLWWCPLSFWGRRSVCSHSPGSVSPLSLLSVSPVSPVSRSLAPIPLDKLTGEEWKLLEDETNFPSKPFLYSFVGLNSRPLLIIVTMSLLKTFPGTADGSTSLCFPEGFISKSWPVHNDGNNFFLRCPYVLIIIIARIQNDIDNNVPATMAGTNMYSFSPTWKRT